MEIAGQWRREWAGTAEYGNVTEGGVTKRVARAMEVLHASAPGARVRVLRAAYHATAGPGAPASSYMLQSSRRVISSGYDFVEPTSLPTKPLEISSLPLEITDTEADIEKQNYKVTEPDDLDISEPSKWRSGGGRNPTRMPSEESSSTDNASIIDLDSRIHRRNSFKNHVLDNNQESGKSVNPKNNRVSPLLDAPVSLSTLKFKSLLNGSDDWNNRRKSYSFEDTTPLNRIILDRNDRFAIESSTDSGICKSSEVVNDIENTRYKPKERKSDIQEETFKDWLYKNRHGSQLRPLKEHSITPERLCENNITLQSSGKVCITLPITIESENDTEYKKPQFTDESDRKSKKVEFCKTELHFAADTGTVNIIATDEKPPPTNDFRRRRSAFVPINDRFEKSVTLFGEKTDFHENRKTSYFSSCTTTEVGDSDENTAATKSILKNKIPKPKPYLLGENMILGNDDNVIKKSHNINNAPLTSSGVSLINAQLKPDKKNCSETISVCATKVDSSAFTYNSYRTTNEGTFRQSSQPAVESNKKMPINYETADNIATSSIKRKMQIIQTPPTLGRSNSRQLRESDLMYFGVRQSQERALNQQENQDNKLYDKNNEQEEIFESVRLVRKVSSSVCSSEIESDEAPEYQNIPSKPNYTPVAAPRLRIKYNERQTETKAGNLNSIKEQDNDEHIPTLRRTRIRRQDTSSPSSRSISEPPKISRSRFKEPEYNPKNKSRNSPLRMKSNGSNKVRDLKDGTISEDSTSIYVNLRVKEINMGKDPQICRDSKQKPQIKKDTNLLVKDYSTERTKAQKNHNHDETGGKKSVRRSDSLNSKSNMHDTSQSRVKTKIQRTEKLVTPDLSHSGSRRIKSENVYDTKHKTVEKDFVNSQGDYRIRSLRRHTNPDPDAKNTLKKETKTSKAEPKRERTSKNFESKHSLINNINLSNISPNGKPDSLIKPSSKVKNEISEKYYETKKSRSEYVINYDDKKGTVSSVRKIKHASDLKKNPTKENSNENVRNKQLNKIALRRADSRSKRKEIHGKGKQSTKTCSKTVPTAISG